MLWSPTRGMRIKDLISQRFPTIENKLMRILIINKDSFGNAIIINETVNSRRRQFFPENSALLHSSIGFLQFLVRRQYKRILHHTKERCFSLCLEKRRRLSGDNTEIARAFYSFPFCLFPLCSVQEISSTILACAHDSTNRRHQRRDANNARTHHFMWNK